MVATVPALSVAWIVNWNAPIELAVPLKTPLPLKVVPDGIDPLAPHTYGGTPPVAVNWVLNAVPSGASAKAEVVMVRGGALMVRRKPALAVAPVESVTWTVKR